MSWVNDDDGFAAFEIVTKRRGRSRWKWAVRANGGEVVMSGSECSRAAARYKAARALFRLLCASVPAMAERVKPQETSTINRTRA